MEAPAPAVVDNKPEPVRKSSQSSLPENATKQKESTGASLARKLSQVSNTSGLKVPVPPGRKTSASSMVSVASSMMKKRNQRGILGRGSINRMATEQAPLKEEVVMCANYDLSKLDTKEKTQDAIEEYIQSEISELYKSLDINGNDFLSVEEIKWAFHFFGKNDVTIEEATIICEELSGVKGSDNVTSADFAKEMHETMTNSLGENEARLIFDVMDVHSQGFVGPNGIMHLFSKFGVYMDEKEAFDYIDEICKGVGNGNKYGVFDFEQFRHYINRLDATYGVLKNHYWTMLSKEL